MTTLTFTATQNTIEASAYFRTADEAEQLAAIFPKSAKVRTAPCSTYRGGSFDHLAPEGTDYEFTVYGVVFSADLRSTGTTGAKNEGGLKRWASVKRAAAKYGVAIEYAARYSNSLSADDAAAL